MLNNRRKYAPHSARKGNPDVLVNGEYMDIKTLREVGKTRDRIHEGYTQCVNRGQRHGAVILSSLRIEPVDERYMRYTRNTVNRKKRNGQTLRVYALRGDSSIIDVL